MKKELSSVKNCLIYHENFIEIYQNIWKASRQVQMPDLWMNKKRIDDHKKGIQDEHLSAIEQMVINKLDSKFMEF